MEGYDNTELMVNETQTEEVYVTNSAIKATDVLMLIGAGAFALTGIGLFINNRRKKKLMEERAALEQRIIENLIKDGATDAEIANAKKILENI